MGVAKQILFDTDTSPVEAQDFCPTDAVVIANTISQ
jgi:hypothetical protein